MPKKAGMGLPSEDPQTPRMPTWVFVLIVVWVAFITYAARILHLWWGWLGVLVTVQAALLIRTRWRNPAIIDRWGKPMDEKVAKYGPKIWAGMGYVAIAFGLLFIVVAASSLVEQFLTQNLWNVWGALAAGIGGVGFVLAGRWLTHNRRQPFTPR
jgi:hypothetical protein